MDSKPIAIVVPQNAQSLDISGPLDAFLEANRQAPGRCNYDVRLLSVAPDRAVKAGSMSLVAHGSIFEDEGLIDTLLVAGTPDYAQAYAESALPAWLRRQARAAVGTGRSAPAPSFSAPPDCLTA
jgi:transcriptional regulator GlxA family with amidase domain